MLKDLTDTGSIKGLVPSGNKPLSKPILILIMSWLGRNDLTLHQGI